MGNNSVEKVKLLWNIWDIRGLMLTSLLIQALLTLLAPFRKRCSNSFLKIFLWMLYLSADAVALFTIGLISNHGDHAPAKGGVENAELLAFWAPFLLLHLGGPDTITALALEDNELWRRHALQLATQVTVTLYVFGRTVRQSRGLLIPTILMFVDGCIKYIERTCALYFASMGCFRDSHRTKPEAGPNYARLMEEYSSAINGSVPANIQGKGGPLVLNKGSERNDPQNDSVESTGGGGSSSAEAAKKGSTAATSHWYHIEENDGMIEEAYDLYNKFKGLLADSFLSLKDRDESRTIFLGKPAPQTFRILEIELNFVYDVFYTKVFLLHRRRRYARILCFLSVIASIFFFWFWCKDRKDQRWVDVVITFALLGGALALDITTNAIFLLSDWCIILPYLDGKRKFLRCLQKWLPRCSRCAWYFGRKCWSQKSCFQKRWSESISKYNLLTQCLKDPLSLLDQIFISWIKDVLIGWLYVQESLVDSRLGDFIMEELEEKAKHAVDAESIKEVCSARGNLVFQDDYLLVSEYLRPWTVDVDYDESLLTWHLATDMCYWTRTKEEDGQSNYRELSKDMSDYMAYLFLRQKALVSTVVGASDVRSEDTCAEAKKFTNKRLDGWFADVRLKIKKLICKIICLQTTAQDEKQNKREREILGQFCEKVLEVKAEVRPTVAKGDKSKSVLFDACRLAKQLKMFGEDQWLITAKVWVELLSYAAVRCAPRSHVAELSNGGQFITLVWLLMAHLGLGERFRQNRGFGVTKLIIPK